jgi:hypothetical protein
MACLTLEFGFFSNIRFSRTASWPARRVAAATSAAPSGRVGILIVSVLAEIRRTLMIHLFTVVRATLVVARARPP